MQVADAYLGAFSTRDDRSNVLAIVTTVAVHVLIAFGLAVSAGYVPLVAPEPRTQVIPVPDRLDPPVVVETPQSGVPVITTGVPFVGEPVIDVEQVEPPVGETTRITTGGGGGTREPIVQTFTEVRLLSGMQPDYPPTSRRLSEEGIVLVRITISPYGTIGDVQLEKSSGYPRLDEAALRAVRAWRFAPARRGSEAIVSSVLVPVKFEIK